LLKELHPVRHPGECSFHLLKTASAKEEWYSASLSSLKECCNAGFKIGIWKEHVPHCYAEVLVFAV